MPTLRAKPSHGGARLAGVEKTEKDPPTARSAPTALSAAAALEGSRKSWPERFAPSFLARHWSSGMISNPASRNSALMVRNRLWEWSDPSFGLASEETACAAVGDTSVTGKVSAFTAGAGRPWAPRTRRTIKAMMAHDRFTKAGLSLTQTWRLTTSPQCSAFR